MRGTIKKTGRRILERNQRRRDKEIEPNERDLSMLSGPFLCLMSLFAFKTNPCCRPVFRRPL